MVSPRATTCVRMSPRTGAASGAEGCVAGPLSTDTGVTGVTTVGAACVLAIADFGNCGTCVGGALVIIGTLPRFSAAIQRSALSLPDAPANGSVGLVAGPAASLVSGVESPGLAFSATGAGADLSAADL